jgi:XTP/dITP diphosphohydrolase
MELVFATNNLNKLEEIQSMLGNKFHLLSLTDIGCNVEIPETTPTIEGNASQKAHYIFDEYQLNCFADDTGLEIEALNNEPGVYSARYAGDERNFEANIRLVLSKLNGVVNRKARFRTVISLITDGEEHFFEGIVNGLLLDYKRGEAGFGYDPIFVPDGYSLTFAEMTMEMKNTISHRGIAFRRLIEHLQK